MFIAKIFTIESLHFSIFPFADERFYPPRSVGFADNKGSLVPECKTSIKKLLILKLENFQVTLRRNVYMWWGKEEH